MKKKFYLYLGISLISIAVYININVLSNNKFNIKDNKFTNSLYTQINNTEKNNQNITYVYNTIYMQNKLSNNKDNNSRSKNEFIQKEQKINTIRNQNLIKERILREIINNINNLNEQELYNELSKYINKGYSNYIENLKLENLNFDKKIKAVLYLIKANLQNNKKNNVLAKKYYVKALEHNISYNNLFAYAIFLYNNSEFIQSKKYFTQALKYTEDNYSKAILFNWIGIIEQKYNLNNALINFNNSIKYKKILIQNENTNINNFALANSYYNLGNTYKLQKEYIKSLEYYIKASTLFRKFNYIEQEAIVLNAIGKNYLLLNDTNFEFVKDTFINSNKNLLKLKVKNYVLLVNNYLELAKLYIIYNSTHKTKSDVYSYFELALKYNDKLEFTSPIKYKENYYSILSELAHYSFINERDDTAKFDLKRAINILDKLIEKNINKEKYIQEKSVYLYNLFNIELSTYLTSKEKNLDNMKSLFSEITKQNKELFTIDNNKLKHKYKQFLCLQFCNLKQVDKDFSKVIFNEFKIIKPLPKVDNVCSCKSTEFKGFYEHFYGDI